MSHPLFVPPQPLPAAAVDRSVVHALARVIAANRWLNTVSEARGLGSTRQQSRAAMYLAQQESMTVNELAETLVLSASRASRLADELIAAGLAVRVPDERDRRVVRVMLTPHARQRCEELQQERVEAVHSALAGLPPEVVGEVEAALQRVAGEYEALARRLAAAGHDLPTC